LGERFTPFVKNGQVVDLWKEDGGTSSEWPYKNVPFFQARRWRLDQPPQAGLAPGGLGGPTFCGPTERGDVERVQSSVPGETLEYFLIYGPTPMAAASESTRPEAKLTLDENDKV
jgi:alpha-D-xyloside xylohydrolase